MPHDGERQSRSQTFATMNSRRDPRVMPILRSILDAGYRNFGELMLSLVRSDLASVSRVCKGTALCQGTVSTNRNRGKYPTGRMQILDGSSEARPTNRFWRVDPTRTRTRLSNFIHVESPNILTDTRYVSRYIDWFNRGEQ